jgi:Fe2+ transport system protein FeoA
MVGIAPDIVSRPLTAWGAGEVAIVDRVDLDQREASMLRAMGLRPGALVRLSSVGEPSVVEVVSGHTCRCHCRCRIGVARGVAEKIYLRAEG